MRTLPYDISAIPYFAWAPGVSTWVAFLIVAAITVYLTRRYTGRRRKRREPLDPFVIAKAELEGIARIKEDTRAELAKMSLVLRRLLAVAAAFPADNLTLQELAALAAKSKSAATIQIALLLESLESALYGPRDVEPLFVREAVHQALMAVQELKLEKNQKPFEIGSQHA